MRRLILATVLVLIPLLAGFDLRKDQGGGGQVIPGFEGGTCNDLCRQWMDEELYEPIAMPDFPVYWFDAQNGLDTNPCTEDLPCQDAELIEVIANYGQAIIRMKGDYNDTAAGEAMETWDGWDFAPPACDEPYCLYLLAWEKGQSATLDCSADLALTGSSGLQPVTFAGSVLVGDVTFLHCPPEPKDVTGNLAFHNGLDVVSATANVTFLGTRVIDGAGVHYHPIRFSASNTGVVINAYVRPRDFAAFDEDCATAGQVDPTECADQDTIPLSLCTDLDTPHEGCTADITAGDSQGQGRPHLVESPFDVIVLGGRFEINNTQHDAATNGPYFFIEDGLGAGVTWIVDGALGIPPPTLINGNVPTASNIGFFKMNFTNLTSTDNGFLSRNTVLPWPSNATSARGVRGDNDDSVSTAGVMNISLYQNTIVGAFAAVDIPGQFANDTINAEGQCNNFDEVQQTSGDAYIIVSSSGAGNANFDFDGTNLYDTDDGVSEGGSADPDSFSFGGAAGTWDTASEVSRSDPVGNGAPTTINSDWFGTSEGGAEGALEVGGEGTDGNVYGATEAQGIAASSRNACTAGSRRIAIAVKFQEQFTPILGAPLTAIERGTHWKGIGAR